MEDNGLQQGGRWIRQRVENEREGKGGERRGRKLTRNIECE